MMSSRPDVVIIHNLRAQAIVGPDRWAKVRAQPITLSVSVEIPIVTAGESDNVVDSIHYGDLAKNLVKQIDGAAFDNLNSLATSVVELVFNQDERIGGVVVETHAGNQFLQAQSLGLQVRRTREGGILVPDKTSVKDLAVSTIIGVNPPEREEKQVVLVNLTFYSFDWAEADWKRTHARVVQVRLVLF
jgi:dihydroneopterin aldolase/2-amino-4-hydroxy-6-hydroxymethyldihydropteridine diphosphokinase/dihydropteroate synthase/2-amino-4-hydroxy-6-hydroxymethyldihydropteridine diphosphokinase/dihydropteroate synthase